MADTNEIMNSARALGQLISTHPAVNEYKQVMRQLELDVGAQQLFGQFQQLMQQVIYKEQSGQPADFQEKQQLQSMSQSIKMHPTLSKFIKSQEEIRSLMEGVQSHIDAGLSGQASEAQAPAGGQPQAPAAPAPAPSKIILE